MFGSNFPPFHKTKLLNPITFHLQGGPSRSALGEQFYGCNDLVQTIWTPRDVPRIVKARKVRFDERFAIFGRVADIRIKTQQVFDHFAVRSPSGTDYRSAKPLRDAANPGFYSIIQLFLAQNLTQHELDQMLEDVVALHREDLVRLLPGSGAHAINRYETFSSTLWSGHPGIVRLFIEHGADLKTGSPLAWAFSKSPHRSLVGVFKDLVRNDPSLLIQATQALNEQLTARNERWISLLLWVGADPRLSVDHLEMGDYKQSPLEHAVRAGNLPFLKKAGIDPIRDDIVRLLR